MYRFLFVLCFCSAISYAQESLDSFAFSVDMESLVITSEYEPTHYKNAMHRVDVISKTDIENRGSVTLEEALLLSPAIRTYYDPVLGTSVRMRGINAANVLILIDGIPVIGRLGGAIDISQISLQNVERIEIVEGALSNIYGSNAAGGVINIITKKSQVNKFEGEVSSQLESIGQQNFQTRLGYKSDKFLAAIHGRRFNYDQFPIDSLRIFDEVELDDGTSTLQARYPFNPKTQNSIGGITRYQLDDDGHIMLKYDYNIEVVNDYGIQKRPQFRPYADDSEFKTIRSDVSLNFRKKFNNTFIEFTTSFNQYDRFTDSNRLLLESLEIDSLNSNTDTSRFTNFFNKLVISQPLSQNTKLFTGVNISHETGSGDRIINRENLENIDQAAFTESAFFTELRNNSIKGLDLSLSGRYIYHNLYSSKFTPAFSAKLDLGKKWDLRFGYAIGYRNPSLKELYIEFIDINHYIIGNTDLQPETSTDIQFDINYELNKNFDINAKIYSTKIDDRISLLQFETARFRYDNISEYDVRGIQSGVLFKNRILDINSQLSFGYWATNISEDDAPDYGFNMDVNTLVGIKFPQNKLTVNLNHRYVGQQPIYRIESGTVTVNNINDYSIVDASISMSLFKSSLQFVLGVQNLLNLQDSNITGAASSGAHGSSGRSLLSPGRSYFLNVKYNFGI